VKRQHDNPGAKPDSLRSGGNGGEADLRRGAIPILRKVVRRRPDRIEAEHLGFGHQFHLFLDDLVFGASDRILEQMQHANFHDRFLDG
jgi:hypothetical protein